MALPVDFGELLAAAKHGSEWAWGELLRELGPRLLAYGRSQGHPDEEDLLGQVLEGMVRGLERFEGGETAFRSWVFTIAHSRIVDERRRSARRPRVADRELPDVHGPAPDAHVASETLSREHALALLDRLPAKQRDVVALRVVAGLSVEETAQVLGRRPGAIRVAMHRGLVTLREEPREEV